MKLSCPDFAHNQMMPQKMTCQGKGISPSLFIEEIPLHTKSLVLIVDDPDAPGGTYVHWVVYNIPPTPSIKEGVIPGMQGMNTAHQKDYVPACPPSGKHRYFFKIYALKEMLSFAKVPTKTEVEKAMKGLLLGSAELIGLFEKS